MDPAQQTNSSPHWENSRVVVVDPSGSYAAPLLALFIADLLAVLISFSLVRLVAADAARAASPWLLAGFFAYFLGLLIFGLYPGRGKFGPERVRQRAYISLLAFVPSAIAIGEWITGDAITPRMCLLATGILLFLFGTFLEIVFICVLVRMKLWQLNAIILGDPASAGRVKMDMDLYPELGLHAINVIETPQAQPGALLQTARQGEHRGIYVVDTFSPLPSFHAGDSLVSNFLGSQQGSWVGMLKRAIDVAGACAGLLIAGPVMLATAVLIMMADGRPIFFKQARGGKDGKPIGVWKFRSMYRDAPEKLESVLAADPAARAEWNQFFKLRNDPRILPGIGPFIRKSSIDELPQLWNVLKGEMSLVGPRPFPENHLSVFSPEFRNIRHSVVPGITGLWQITLRSDGNLAMQEKLDTAYVQGWSIWLDLYILFRTPVVLLTSRGAR